MSDVQAPEVTPEPDARARADFSLAGASGSDGTFGEQSMRFLLIVCVLAWFPDFVLAQAKNEKSTAIQPIAVVKIDRKEIQG